MKTDEPKMKVTATVGIEVPIRRVQDMLCCAFEGGANYWYRIEKFHEPKEFVHFSDKPYGEEKHKPQIFRHLDYPVNPGGYLIVSDAKLGNEVDKITKKKLDIAACMTGLKVMAEKYPRHFADMMADNDDAITGDVFLQCCLFGEVLYG